MGPQTTTAPSGPAYDELARLDPRAYAAFIEKLDRSDPEPERGENVTLEDVFRMAEAEAYDHEPRWGDLLLDGELHDSMLRIHSGGYYSGGMSFIMPFDGFYAEAATGLVDERAAFDEHHLEALRTLPSPEVGPLARWLSERFARAQAELESYLSVTDALTLALGYDAVGVRYDASELLDASQTLRTLLKIDNDAWDRPSDGESPVVITRFVSLTGRTSLAQIGIEDASPSLERLAPHIADPRFVGAVERLPHSYYYDLGTDRRLYTRGVSLEGIFGPEEARELAEMSLKGIEPATVEAFKQLIAS